MERRVSIRARVAGGQQMLDCGCTVPIRAFLLFNIAGSSHVGSFKKTDAISDMLLLWLALA